MIGYQFGALSGLAASIVCAGMGEGEHEQQPQIKEFAEGGGPSSAEGE